ncbi:uncharacterized protein LOC143195716 isoform X3 [Rhynchophorus ferrugineus]|uniref:uncharacterized protein LOC143195716 isoform X3 n=1 Tax=Rhynchophorus ferrugineus TaxID=354439 RepID=UPI003FCDBFA1
MLIFKLINMQHYCGLLLIVIWLSLFLTEVNCSCSKITVSNQKILVCQSIDTNILNNYLRTDYSLINVVRITNSSLNRLDHAKLRNVQYLELESNNITTILPGYFHLFSDLRNLSLARNNISRIIEGVFREMSFLQTINLSRNQIEQLNSHTFIGLNKLTNIDLSFNQLKQLPEEIFTYQGNIRYLNIAHNKFTSISIPKTSIIDKLNASFNQIEAINESFNYICLDVSFNNITQINDNTFREASRLEELYLQHNFLDTLPSNVFIKLNKLKVLDLSYNRLSLYQKGPNNDWLHILSPISLSVVLLDHNLFSCDPLRNILTNLQVRKINIGNHTSVNSSNVLGIECNDINFQEEMQVNETVVSKIFDKIQYLQESILQLKKDTQLNVSNLKSDIIQLNKSKLEIPDTADLVDKNLTDVSPLLEICNDSESKNLTKCLTELFDNIQDRKMSDINLKLNRIIEQALKQQYQDVALNESPATTSHVFPIITDILLILILSGVVCIIYIIRKKKSNYINKEQISLM